MRYIANHYIRTGNQVLKKGDILPELPEEKIQWLLKAGAIRQYEPEPWMVNEAVEEAETETREAEPTEPEEAMTEEDEYELPEVPEIDAMEGIVVDETPKRKRTQKKAKGE